MNGHFVHALIAEENARTLGDACERALPMIQREFGNKVTAKQVYDDIMAHRESLELVEAFRDECMNADSISANIEQWRHAGSVRETLGYSIRTDELRKNLCGSLNGIFVLKDKLKSLGINPDNCSYFPSAICELYKSARMIGEQTEMVLENSTSLTCKVHGMIPYSHGFCPWCEGENEK